MRPRFLRWIRELGRDRRLADALQAEQHDGDETARFGERRVDGPHQVGQLLLADGDEVLPGTDLDLAAARVARLGADLLAEAAVLDPVQEVLDHGEVDVRLEQRHADVAQGLVDVLFGKLAHTAKALGGGLEAFGDVLEQRPSPGGAQSSGSA